MKFLVSVIDDTTGSATPGEMVAIGTFNDWLRAAGHWVFAGGLAAPVWFHTSRHIYPAIQLFGSLVT